MFCELDDKISIISWLLFYILDKFCYNYYSYKAKASGWIIFYYYYYNDIFKSESLLSSIIIIGGYYYFG